MMEFTNALTRIRDDRIRAAGPVDADAWDEAIEALTLCLAPAAPHITEELWSLRGGDGSVHEQLWPKWDDELARDQSVTVIVQINGKVREKLSLAPGVAQAEAEAAARASERISSQLAGKALRRTIWVPDRLLNFVAN